MTRRADTHEMPSRDEHGDRMKAYERAAETALDRSLPIYARIDGRAFSSFTRGMARPFDPALSSAMVQTTIGLVSRTHAKIGYTQSDEISLVFLADGPEAEPMFGGRIQKLASVLASLAAALFAEQCYSVPALQRYAPRLPHFDCRVCGLPTRTEAANMLVWRYKDARKNAIQAAAQTIFSPKAMHGKHGGELLAMLADRGIAFDDYPDFFRSGTFVRRKTVWRELPDVELARVPPKHRPAGPVQRSVTEGEPAGDFLACTNREAFVFEGAEMAR